jgi:DNA-directed RNA polymerase specialized sigma24 family protein
VAALARYNPRWGAVVALKAAGWTNAEIAGALDVTYGVVKALLYRAQQHAVARWEQAG